MPAADRTDDRAPCGGLRVARGICAACAIAAGLAAGEPALEPPITQGSTPGLSLYDPLRGMDENGRIPRAPIPADVPNAERWRYVPEGRIMPGNVFERLLVSSFVSPVFYFEEDIGAGGGVALTDIDFRGTRRREFIGLFAGYTTEGQESYTLVWKRAIHHRDLPAGGVISEERSFLRAQLGYERTRTRRFFGLGPDSDEDDETSYTDESSGLSLRLQHSFPRPGDDWIQLVGLRVEHHNLARGRVKRVPSTTDAFAGPTEDGDSHDALWLTAGLAWDTRDSLHQPYRGVRIAAAVDAAPLQSGGDSGGIAELQAQAVMPVWSPWHDGGDRGEENPPTDTIAINAFVEATAGDLPFYDLPSLGGPDTLRGYIAGRFTDRAAWHATVEYRTWPVPRGFAITRAIRMERLGLALFYELGSVADDLDDLRAAQIHQSYGVGFRMAFERTAVFRVDIGFSDEDTAVTASFGTSF